MYELDHPGFLLKDAKGLQVVVYGIQKGLGMDVLFPVELVYRPWKCTEGQVSVERGTYKFSLVAAVF